MMSMDMTDAELLWRQLNFMEAFCGCEDCADALKEQSSPALEVMDCGIAVGRTPAGLPKHLAESISTDQVWHPSPSHTTVNTPVPDVPYSNQSHKIYDGDISKLMGALA